MDNTKEFQKELDKYKKTTIAINRIPEKYKTRFMEIAKEEFSNDYGMCLRELIRTWDGIFTHPNDEINTKIDILAEEIRQLKEEKPNEKKKMTASGKIIE